MVGKVLLALSLLAGSVNALDFRYGKGSFDTDISIKYFMDHEIDYDIDVFALSEQHKPFSSYPLFFYYDAELYVSDTQEADVDFANPMADIQMPFFGSANDMLDTFTGFFPVHGDYDALGFDFNFGLGYDLYRKGESFFGIAINSGASMPMMSAENLEDKGQFAFDLMDTFDLDISTYKIGPALKANFVLNNKLSLYGSYSYGFQTATIESDLFKSDVDVDGSYSLLDIGLRFRPWKEKTTYGSITFSPKLSFTLGHTNKSWEVDSVKVNLYGFRTDIFRPFTADYKSSYTYLSVGYSF